MELRMKSRGVVVYGVRGQVGPEWDQNKVVRG